MSASLRRFSHDQLARSRRVVESGLIRTLGRRLAMSAAACDLVQSTLPLRLGIDCEGGAREGGCGCTHACALPGRCAHHGASARRRHMRAHQRQRRSKRGRRRTAAALRSRADTRPLPTPFALHSFAAAAARPAEWLCRGHRCCSCDPALPLACAAGGGRASCRVCCVLGVAVQPLSEALPGPSRFHCSRVQWSSRAPTTSTARGLDAAAAVSRVPASAAA